MAKLNWRMIVGGLLLVTFIVISIIGPYIAPFSPEDRVNVEYELSEDGKGGTLIAPPLEPFESSKYIFGTNLWGQDLLTLILYGLRYTLMVSFLVALFRIILGGVIGMYIGIWKRQPNFVLAFERAWSFFPQMIIALFLLAPVSFLPNAPPVFALTVYFMMIAICIGAPSTISSVRQKTREIYKSTYLDAAKVLGASNHRIVWKHIFPQLKESFIVGGLLEIVYTITLMGQLAIFNVFIGGTIVQFDPIIFLSITNEIAGLIGQARDNVFGYQYVLFVPLVTLLILTLSITTFAEGLNQYFASVYKKSSWLKQKHKLKVKIFENSRTKVS